MAGSKKNFFITVLFTAAAIIIPSSALPTPTCFRTYVSLHPLKRGLMILVLLWQTGIIKVNGFPCKDEANVTASDFFFAGLANPAAINNSIGFAATVADVNAIPGLNTLGLSLARVEYSPGGGLVPPHVHPRATEVVFVLDGELDVGFITTANKLVAKTIRKGEVFVFPKGLLHFQRNSYESPASAFVVFNSQLFGTQTVAAALFGASPAVDDAVLAGAFQIGADVVAQIKSNLPPTPRK